MIAVQVVVCLALAGALAASPETARDLFRWTRNESNAKPVCMISRIKPLRVEPLFNDPSVVSDADLMLVLNKTIPRFSRKHLKPNFVEHALRTWGADATFRDPAAMSGTEMRDFLIDHGRYVESWSNKVEPLLVDEPDGVSVRWGHAECASVHHDHLLACLTEANVPLDTQVYPPGGAPRTLNDLLQQSLRDFRLDEREVEWSAMAFGLWLAPSAKTTWTTGDGRRMSFDLIAERLMRGHQRFGVCNGTHRVYSLALLLRLNHRYRLLSNRVRDDVVRHLRGVRDRLIASQFPDGHWPSNWSDGADALANPVDDPDYKKVIATGHHLEWLAIAPVELHPPRDRIRKAARWLVKNVREHDDAHIQQRYTFYSHVASALAGWRRSRPIAFLHQHRPGPSRRQQKRRGTSTNR